ncbi:MAG: galactosyldiacylglycerol synthase, partial [Clostridioides sp.]|nr:galactosyldiacylglycerol synthase [Clostridioides sp.]
MNEKLKTVLIFTAPFGAGHTSAANAIKDYIIADNPDCVVKIKNFMNICAPLMNKPMISLYENNTKYTPIIYNSYYYIRKNVDTKHDMSYMFYTSKITEYISEIMPDLIISTFPFASGCVNDFKLKNPYVNIPTVTVITDVVDSNEWIFETTDMYFVPSREIKNRLVNKGLSPEDIKITGVPVNQKFFMDCKSPSNYNYRILILGGGRGLFDIDETMIERLDSLCGKYKSKLKITIVTGKNEKLFKYFTEKSPLENIEVLGFVNNMPELMLNHDIIITKPGGATLFEAINSKTPIIIKYPKVGQEIENTKFIIDKGIGLVYKNEFELENIFQDLVDGKLDEIISYLQQNLCDFRESIHPDYITTYI